MQYATFKVEFVLQALSITIPCRRMKTTAQIAFLEERVFWMAFLNQTDIVMKVYFP